MRSSAQPSLAMAGQWRSAQDLHAGASVWSWNTARRGAPLICVIEDEEVHNVER
jgi:hypothetical protein